MTPWRVFKYLLLVLLLAGGGYALWRYQGSVNTPDQAFGVVTRGDLTLKVTIAGGIVPKRRAMIAPPYNGYVQKLFVKIGDHVKEGSPIVSIAQAIGAKQEEVFPLRSPLAGRVVQVWRKEGEYVSTTPGGPQADITLVRIDDTSRLYVEASAPEVEIDKLKVGLPVVIRAVAVPQHPYKGKIVEITQAAKEQERWEKSRVEFPLTAELLDPDGQLKSGMSAVLDIIVSEAKGVLQLRHEYVQKVGNDYFVTTLEGQRKPIQIGLENEEAFEVKSGVSEGEKIRQVDFLAAAAGEAP